MGFFEPSVMGQGAGGRGQGAGGRGHDGGHHNFVVISPIIIKFGNV